MGKNKSIGLKSLEKDKAKVMSDIQRLQQDLVGTQYILRFLNQQIQSLNGGSDGR